nr:hypothetical protein [uncultured Rhodopila sp.]
MHRGNLLASPRFGQPRPPPRATPDRPDRQYFPGISGNGGADRHRSSRCSLSGGFGYGPALKLAAVASFPHRLHAAPYTEAASVHFGNSICREYDHPSMKANTVAFGRPSDPDPTAPSLNDPMKAAHQVIRSQAARDYAERELVHAEATIQELRTKLHHAHREKDAALEAARLATAAKLAAQRSMLEAEASRDRSDRALREALVTKRNLQATLDAFARGFETAKAKPAAERQARQTADDSRREAPLVTAREAVLPASHDDAVIQSIRRPVGRPRKTAATAPAPASNKTDGKASDSDEIIAETAGNLQKKARNREAAGQEPVQWWVKGWNGRGS